MISSWLKSLQIKGSISDITATRCYDAVYNLSIPQRENSARVERDTHLAVEVLEVAGVLQKE